MPEIITHITRVYDPSAKVEAEAPGPATIFSSNSSTAQNGLSVQEAIRVDDEDDELHAPPQITPVEPMGQVLEWPDKHSSPIFAGELPSGTSWSALLSLIPASFMAKHSPERVPQSSLSTPICIDDSDSDVEGVEDLPSTTAPSDITVRQKTNTGSIADEMIIDTPGPNEPEFEETWVDSDTLAPVDTAEAKRLPRKEPASSGGLLERAFALDWEEPSSDVAVDDEFSSDDDVPVGRKFAKPSVIVNPSHSASPLNTVGEAYEEGWSSESDDSDSSRTSPALQHAHVTPFSRSKNFTRPTAKDNVFVKHSPNIQSSSRRKPPHQKSSHTATTSARPPDSIGNHATSSSDRESSSLVMLPSAPNAKPRRLLVPSTKGLALVTITMRGDVNFLDPARNLYVAPQFSANRCN